MRVLFTTLPQSGHFHPLVPVARALREAGHDVAFACPASFATKVEAAGFRALPAGFDDRGEAIPTLFPGGSRHPVDERVPFDERVPWLYTRGFIGIYGAVMAIDLLKLCRDWQPDLLVRDTSEFGGCVAAEALGLPHATVRTGGWGATYALRHRWTEALAPLRDRAGLDPDLDAEMPFRYEPPASIPESASIGMAMALLREHGIHRLPVIREGRVVGIITGSDLLLAMLAPIESDHEQYRREELMPSPEQLASVGSD